MSKYQALIDALEAGPTDGPFTVAKEEELEGCYDIKTPDGYFVATTHSGVRDEVDSRPLADFFAAANPATIRALLADLERAEKALKEVVAVFDSNPSSICDTVWVTGNRPETLYDHCQDVLAQITQDAQTP